MSGQKENKGAMMRLGDKLGAAVWNAGRGPVPAPTGGICAWPVLFADDRRAHAGDMPRSLDSTRVQKAQESQKHRERERRSCR